MFTERGHHPVRNNDRWGPRTEAIVASASVTPPQSTYPPILRFNPAAPCSLDIATVAADCQPAAAQSGCAPRGIVSRISMFLMMAGVAVGGSLAATALEAAMLPPPIAAPLLLYHPSSRSIGMAGP